MFVKAVAQQRGVSQATVREGMGQGRSLLATDAVKAGLADRVGTLDDVLEKYGVKKSAGSRTSALNPPQPVAGPLPDQNEEDEARAEACKACKACSASSFCGCKDGDIDCGCACSPCQSCENKGGAHAPDYKKAIERRRRQLSLH
jgi:ClpP class serine protease